MIVDEKEKGRAEVMDDRSQMTESENNLEEIKRRYENNELDDQLKSCFIGGFDKRSVKTALENYREILKWMQENFDSQLQDIISEKEKSISECSFLKRQLQDVMEKTMEADEIQAKYDALNASMEEKEEEIKGLAESLRRVQDEEKNWKKEMPLLRDGKKKLEDEKKKLEDEYRKLEDEKGKLEDEYRKLEDEKGKLEDEYRKLKDEKGKLEDAYESLEDQQKDLKEEYARLAATKGVVGRNFELNKDTVRDLTRQLESMTDYCQGLENQQAALERQLESMQKISQELDAITKESNISKEELRGYQKKYITIKRENDDLNGELESAGRLLSNILEQYEQKDTESSILKRDLAEQKQQVVKSLKEKLELQNTNVSLMEQIIALESRIQVYEKENQMLRKDFETLNKEYRQLESSKVIKFSAPGGAEAEHKAEEGLNSAKDLA